MNTSEIKAIQESHIPIKSINEIPQIVERPLIKAVENLFKKGIETFMSSANEKNIYITIFYDSLSKENKKIANEIQKRYGGGKDISGHSGGRIIQTFSLPDIITPTEYVENRGERIASNFENQSQRIKIRQISYTKQELSDILKIEDIDDKLAGLEKWKILRRSGNFYITK